MESSVFTDPSTPSSSGLHAQNLSASGSGNGHRTWSLSVAPSNLVSTSDLPPSVPEEAVLTRTEPKKTTSNEERPCIFYKLIVDSIIQDKQLSVPKRFVRRFGEGLSDVVTLINCNSDPWLVGLRKINHRLWFHCGWQKFVEDHSIHAGCFLIFRYEGNSKFSVYIYDLAVSEMKPSAKTGGGTGYTQDKQLEVPSMKCPRSKDIFQAVDLFSPNQAPDCSKDKVFGECMEQKTSIAIGESTTPDFEAYADILMESSDGALELSSPNQADDLQKGKDFGEFTAQAQPTSSTSTKNATLNESAVQVRDHSAKPAQDRGLRLDKDDLMETPEEADLPLAHLANNRTWKRRLLSEVAELDARLNKQKVKKEGPKEASSGLARRSRAASNGDIKRAVLAAGKFKPKLPFCRVTMRQSYVYNKFHLHLPSSFSQKHLKDVRREIILQDSDGKEWPVRCIYRDSNARVSTGWREFVLEHNLDDGDVCVFELLQTKDIVLKVSIFRAVNPEEVVP